jgi:hypothetical protein
MQHKPDSDSRFPLREKAVPLLLPCREPDTGLPLKELLTLPGPCLLIHQPLLAAVPSARTAALLPLPLPLQHEKHESSLWRLQRLVQLLLLAVLHSMPNQLHSSLLPKQLPAPPQPELLLSDEGKVSDFSRTFSLLRSPWQTCSACM